MIKLKIVDLVIEVNMPLKLLHDKMCDFLYKGSENGEIIWNVVFDNFYEIDEKPYVETKNGYIYYKNNKIVYTYNSETSAPFMIVANENFSNCTFYLSKNYENLDKCVDFSIAYIKNGLFKAFKEMFISATVYRGILPIKGESIICDDKAYIFCCPMSGGKTTHINLWRELYDCEVISDNISFIKIDENSEDIRLITYVSPWIEIEDQCYEKRIPLSGIAFIKQGKENMIFDLEMQDFGYNLFENNNVFFITKDMVDKCVQNVNIIAKLGKGYNLTCNKEKDAAIKAYEKMVLKK